METVYIVAIVTAGVGILTLAFIFRKRLTRLGLNIQGNSLDLEAEPDQEATKLPPLPGKGVVLDDSRFKNSNVKVTDSTLMSRGSQVKGSSFEVSESPPSGGQPDG
jgi:hypothetical protein